MKRILTLAAVVAVAAIPAASSGAAETTSVAASKAGHAVKRGGQDLEIKFTIRTLNGKPVKIRRYRFEKLTAQCNGGAVNVRGNIPRMNVNDNGKFDGVAKARRGSGKVFVVGEVNRRGTKANGTIRAKGRFSPATGCDSGRVRWSAN